MSQAGEEEEIQFHSYVVYLLKPSFKWPLSIIDATQFQTLKKMYLKTYETISVS